MPQAAKPVSIIPKDKEQTVLIGALVVVIILIVIVAGIMISALSDSPKTEIVGNRFIDINGDGLIDYMYKAEVIINEEGKIEVTVKPNLP